MEWIWADQRRRSGTWILITHFFKKSKWQQNGNHHQNSTKFKFKIEFFFQKFKRTFFLRNLKFKPWANRNLKFPQTQNFQRFRHFFIAKTASISHKISFLFHSFVKFSSNFRQIFFNESTADKKIYKKKNADANFFNGWATHQFYQFASILSFLPENIINI